MRSRIANRIDKLEIEVSANPSWRGPEWEAVFSSMTNEELEAVISGAEKIKDNYALLHDQAWVDSHLSEIERRSMRKIIDLEIAAGLV